MMMPHDDAVDMHDVQGMRDECAMFLHAQGLDAEHTEQPLGIYSTVLEAATVYARYARMRVPQVALATALATAVALRCAAVCSTRGLTTRFPPYRRRSATNSGWLVK